MQDNEYYGFISNWENKVADRVYSVNKVYDKPQLKKFVLAVSKAYDSAVKNYSMPLFTAAGNNDLLIKYIAVNVKMGTREVKQILSAIESLAKAGQIPVDIWDVKQRKGALESILDPLSRVQNKMLINPLMKLLVPVAVIAGVGGYIYLTKGKRV
jgi:hypothetical protein